MSFSFSMVVDYFHTSQVRASSGHAKQLRHRSLIPAAVATFRLVLTGSRLSKIQMLRWDCVKDDCIELPDANSGGQEVPLGLEARTARRSQRSTRLSLGPR